MDASTQIGGLSRFSRRGLSRFSRSENGTVPFSAAGSSENGTVPFDTASGVPTGTGAARTAPIGPRRRGFTLVEILVVIVIISMLAGMLLVAIIPARNRAKNSVIKAEIEQLQGALQQYKNLYGEYPPDFAFIKDANDDLRNASQDAVIRHLSKRFPRYQPGTLDPATVDDAAWVQFVSDVTAAYPTLSPNDFDPASALTFWLGGLPEAPGDTILAGFHSDATNPFRSGLPRDTESRVYEFNPASLANGGGFLYCLALSGSRPSAPYTYFRSHRSPQSGRYEYGEVVDVGGTPTFFQSYFNVGTFGYAVPYLGTGGSGVETDPTSTRSWRSLETFQLVHPGLDGVFAPTNASVFRYTILGTNLGSADFDNLANFTDRTLEDEMQ